MYLGSSRTLYCLAWLCLGNYLELQYPYYTRNGHLGNIASKSSAFYFDADQVFDLVTDPRETKNIFEDNKEKADELKNLLTKSLKLFPNRPYAEFVN